MHQPPTISPSKDLRDLLALSCNLFYKSLHPAYFLGSRGIDSSNEYITTNVSIADIIIPWGIRYWDSCGIGYEKLP
ncbi:hypothetical protein DPMN_026211 [Dreissena polymorpha]|uniref:Uncharacterized protein n=1 Tax=Dreissena polymorpha TaxID=45954 RepID=A0A9D4LUR1_DREPO|nr:hypothetical protein DPMN_026211 [Dreissena polymorpha]